MECKIRFADTKLKEAFEGLKDSNKGLYDELENAFKDICEDGYYGRQVKKELIPKVLIKKYGIKNLWIYNLRSGWRLIYTLANDEVDVLGIILDWMDHKDYERLFSFKHNP